jgi:hypothetical protein
LHHRRQILAELHDQHLSALSELSIAATARAQIADGETIDELLSRRQRADEALGDAGIDLKAGHGVYCSVAAVPLGFDASRSNPASIKRRIASDSVLIRCPKRSSWTAFAVLADTLGIVRTISSAIFLGRGIYPSPYNL